MLVAGALPYHHCLPLPGLLPSPVGSTATSENQPPCWLFRLCMATVDGGNHGELLSQCPYPSQKLQNLFFFLTLIENWFLPQWIIFKQCPQNNPFASSYHRQDFKMWIKVEFCWWLIEQWFPLENLWMFWLSVFCFSVYTVYTSNIINDYGNKFIHDDLFSQDIR